MFGAKTMKRRHLLAGLAASAAVQPFSAHAQFNLGNLINSAVQVASSMAAGEGDEIKMGEQYYAPTLQKSGGAYNDRNAQDALRRFAQPLMAASDRKSLPWEITLVNSKEVNAWAMPGGKMAINSALISYCQHPDELAAVISHEIGHVDNAHGLAQIRNQSLVTSVGELGNQALSGWMGGNPLAGEALKALEAPLYGMILNGYSRTHEYEADAHILSMFDRVGRDPSRASNFFHTLMRLYPDNSNQTTSLFSTHPGTQDRIARIEDAASRMTKPSREAESSGWNQLKEFFPSQRG